MFTFLPFAEYFFSITDPLASLQILFFLRKEIKKFHSGKYGQLLFVTIIMTAIDNDNDTDNTRKRMMATNDRKSEYERHTPQTICFNTFYLKRDK